MIELTEIQKKHGLRIEKGKQGYWLRTREGISIGYSDDHHLLHRVAFAYSMGFIDGGDDYAKTT